MSKINLSKKELNQLKKAINRVQNELRLHDGETASTKQDLFAEDLKLITFELWQILRHHGLLATGGVSNERERGERS